MDPSLYHMLYEVEDRHWWFVGRRAIVAALLDRVLEKPPAPPGAGGAGAIPRRRILDIGCGTGGMMSLLSRHGDVTGIDSEPLALDYCHKRGFTNVHLQEGFQASEPFDVVTLFDVLEHVSDEAGFLGWIRGLLKPDGHLILTVPAYQWLWSRHDELNHHQRRYTRGRLVAALEPAGFPVGRMTYFNSFLFPLAMIQRTLDRRSRKSAAEVPEEVLAPLRIGILNAPLGSVFASERGVASTTGLPFGMSLFAHARRG